MLLFFNRANGNLSVVTASMMPSGSWQIEQGEDFIFMSFWLPRLWRFEIMREVLMGKYRPDQAPHARANTVALGCEPAYGSHVRSATRPAWCRYPVIYYDPMMFLYWIQLMIEHNLSCERLLPPPCTRKNEMPYLLSPLYISWLISTH